MFTSRTIIPVVAGALLAASGILHAYQTGVWNSGKQLSQAAARLSQIPLSVGDWQGTPLEFDPRQLKAAEAAGALSRVYKSEDSRPMNVMLLCGPHGPIALHPPTVCFTGAGYSQSCEVRRHVVHDAEHRELGSFWVADFDKLIDGAPVRIRTYWAWSDGHAWSAADAPRFEYAGAPVLYKLYVTHVVPNSADDSEVTPDEAASDHVSDSDAFLRQLLPAIQRTAF